MTNSVDQLIKFARKLGYRSGGKQLYDLADWLREEKQIHVEVGSIWDDLNNKVESYCYTVTAPLNIYYTPALQSSGGSNYNEMLSQGIAEGLSLLSRYNEQKHLKVSDDQVVIAYLKGYGDKGRKTTHHNYKSNLEKYAYSMGKQGDYIEEGLTEDDIVFLVRNKLPEEQVLKLE